jgi:hypothetical protein
LTTSSVGRVSTYDLTNAPQSPSDAGYEGGQGVDAWPSSPPTDGSVLDIDTRNPLLRSLRRPARRGFTVLTQR